MNDPASRTTHELDVVAFGLDDGRTSLICLGEAKWGETMGVGHLDRLRRIRALLVAQRRHGARTARLACYSGAGFSPALLDQANHDTGILLVGLDDLYRLP